MALVLTSASIESGQTIRAAHVTQSVDAFTGNEAYDITISGSLTVIGPTNLTGNVGISNDLDVVGTLTTGELELTNLTVNGIANIATANIDAGSISASFTGSLLGTASYATGSIFTSINPALTASYASTASFVRNAVSASYASTASYVSNTLTTASVSLNTITFTKGDSSTFPIVIDTGSGANLASGNNFEIQFNSGSALKATGSFRFNYNIQSLEQGNSSGASGLYSHAEGYGAQALGLYSHAEGEGAQATGESSHAEGQNTYTLGICSHAEGQNTYTLGDCSHAEGQFTYSSGNFSHAEGSLTSASGDYSHAEGSETYALGLYSHAEGNQAKTEGPYSHAEGYQTLTKGNFSHAEGVATTASGHYSHAEGASTVAFGQASHAGGHGTIASGSYQTVVGEWNIHDNITDKFVVGVGIDDSNRKDGFSVTHSGSIMVLTQSSAPAWAGKEGEIVPANNSGIYRIYVYIGGAWRSASLS